MPYYVRRGEVPKKRHVTFYQADKKNLYREELYSTSGFSGPYTNRYRLRMPTRVLRIEERRLPPVDIWESPLQWHLFHTHRDPRGGDSLTSRETFLFNDSVSISVAAPTSGDRDFYKNAHAHELFFIQSGRGQLSTDFGLLEFSSGDYLVLPKGVVYRFILDESTDHRFLVLESSHAFDIPARYKNEWGQLTEEAPFCERDIRPPAFTDPVDQKGEYLVHLKAGTKISTQTWDHHPFDVVGWDGCEYPYAINIRDFAPKVGQIHLPPPVHQIFGTPAFVVCNFVPRLFDFHPDAIPAPYFHTNVDSDEVIYYAEGEFMSRKGIEPGSISLHPMGLPHGPQPGKTEASIGKKDTQEFAVMVDTFAPLKLTRSVEALSDPAYSLSWLEETT